MRSRGSPSLFIFGEENSRILATSVNLMNRNILVFGMFVVCKYASDVELSRALRELRTRITLQTMTKLSLIAEAPSVDVVLGRHGKVVMGSAGDAGEFKGRIGKLQAGPFGHEQLRRVNTETPISSFAARVQSSPRAVESQCMFFARMNFVDVLVLRRFGL